MQKMPPYLESSLRRKKNKRNSMQELQGNWISNTIFTEWEKRLLIN